MPRVSFIVPVRNAAHTLEEAIESMRAQRFEDWEMLVFDDGSTDGTAGILARAAEADARIRVVGAGRVGIVEALRRTIAASDAELLARMDADDVADPRRLELQLELLDGRPELSLVGSLVRCFPDELVESGMRRYERWLNSLVEPEEIARDIFVESPLCHPSVTMRRRAYEEAGGYVDDGNPEDYGLWLRFHARRLAMAKVPRVLLRWRERADRLTRTDERYAPERFLALKLAHLEAGPLAARRTVTVWGGGRTGKMWSRALAECGVRVVAFVDIDPKKVGHTLHGSPVLAPEDLGRGVPGDFLLVAVGADGAREKIRPFLADLGLRDPADYLCLA